MTNKEKAKTVIPYFSEYSDTDQKRFLNLFKAVDKMEKSEIKAFYELLNYNRHEIVFDILDAKMTELEK